MKRDMDLVRQLLLAIEESPDAEIWTAPDVDGFDRPTIVHHLRLLEEADLIVAAVKFGQTKDEDFYAVRLTWKGHEFIETVRDPVIWAQTKRGAKKAGAWSFAIVSELARAAITAKARDLGLLI